MPATWVSDWVVGDVVTKTEYRKSMGCVFDSTLGVAAASFDVTGLPTTYAHLHVVLQVRGDTASSAVSTRMRMNNDSTAVYDGELSAAVAAGGLSGTESVAATSAYLGDASAATASASVASQFVVDLSNYGGTTFASKPWTCQWQRIATKATTGNIVSGFSGGVWNAAAAAAISRLTFFPTSGNWAAGSRCSVYVMGS